MQVVHGLGLLVAVLFTLGLGTRVTSVLAWVYALSLIHRALLAAFGMDTMLAIALFYLMLSPCGARLSLDRLIQRFRRGAVRPGASGARWSRWASRRASRRTWRLRLFQIHFCIIYINSGMSKLQGAAWWNGNGAMADAVELRVHPRPHRALHAGSCTFLAGSLAVGLGHDLRRLVHDRPRISLPFLIWFPRWRPVVLFGRSCCTPASR